MSNKQRVCKTCLYWDHPTREVGGYQAGEIGWCRRFPPVIVNPEKEDRSRIDDTYDRMEWPVTFHADWCGEWKESDHA